MATLNVGMKIAQSFAFARNFAAGVLNSTLYTVPANHYAIISNISFAVSNTGASRTWVGFGSSFSAGRLNCIGMPSGIGAIRIGCLSNNNLDMDLGVAFTPTPLYLTGGEVIIAYSNGGAGAWAFNFGVVVFQNTI